jgi:hypothetical protein
MEVEMLKKEFVNHIKKLILLFVFIFSTQLFSGWGDFFKEDNITRELLDKYSYSFRNYAINIYNCTSGDEFEDIKIPSKLKEKFSETALRRYFKSVYDLCWKEYELQKNSQNWSWNVRSEFASIYETNYYLTVGLTNVSSYPISSLTIVVDNQYTYDVSSRSWSGIFPNQFGKLDCKIPYSLYTKVNNGNSTARIRGIWYK